MLDAYIIDAIRDAENRRDERSRPVLEIDPPRSDLDGEVEPEEGAEPLRGPIVIPLRPDEQEEDDAA